MGACRHEHALLHHAEFDVQNLSKMLVAQRLENDRKAAKPIFVRGGFSPGCQSLSPRRIAGGWFPVQI
jgi:hypothetical protein